jgi:hypothetical protein
VFIAEPLVRSKQAAERRVKLVGIHLFMRLDAVCQNLANVLGHFSRLAHVDARALDLARRVGEWQVA